MDCRDLAGIRSERRESTSRFNRKTQVLTILVEHENDNGEWVEENVEVRCKYEVCPVCEGKGSHVNPSIDYNGLTRDDFVDDPDFAEDYFSGVYDVTCYECGGSNVIPVPDDDLNSPYVLALYEAWANSIEEDCRETWREREYGY